MLNHLKVLSLLFVLGALVCCGGDDASPSPEPSSPASNKQKTQKGKVTPRKAKEPADAKQVLLEKRHDAPSHLPEADYSQLEMTNLILHWEYQKRIDAGVSDRDAIRASSDGRATYAFTDKGVRIMRLRDLKVLHTLDERTKDAKHAAFNYDGSLLAVKCADTIVLYDVESGKESSSFECEGARGAFAINPDASIIAYKIDNSKVGLFSSSNGDLLKTIEIDLDTETQTPLAFSPDGSKLALYGESDNEGILLLDTIAGKDAPVRLKVARGDRGGDPLILSLVFSPNGQSISATTENNEDLSFAHFSLISWDIASQVRSETLLRGFHKRARKFMHFYSNLGQTVSIVEQVGVECQLKIIKDLVITPKKPVQDMVISPDGQMLATLDDEGKIALWNTRKGNLIREFASGSQFPVLTFGPKSRLLATTNGIWQVKAHGDKQVDIDMPSILYPIHPERKGQRLKPYRVAFQDDGKAVACTFHFTSALLVEIPSGKVLRDFGKEGRMVGSGEVQFLAGGKAICFTPTDRRGMVVDLSEKSQEKEPLRLPLGLNPGASCGPRVHANGREAFALGEDRLVKYSFTGKSILNPNYQTFDDGVVMDCMAILEVDTGGMLGPKRLCKDPYRDYLSLLLEDHPGGLFVIVDTKKDRVERIVPGVLIKDVNQAEFNTFKARTFATQAKAHLAACVMLNGSIRVFRIRN